MNGVPDYFQDYLEGLQSPDADATYYDYGEQVIEIPGDVDRGDLEETGNGLRLPKASLPEKIVDLLTATPRTAIVAGLLFLGVLFALRA